jgi:amylosucrase
MLGGVCYVDLFANDLEGVKSKIPYFKELGLTYLHLMPLFKAPEGENDGGYAVSSYREVHPPLGTMEQLASLACEFRQAGISLVVDWFSITLRMNTSGRNVPKRAMKNMRTSTASSLTDNCPTSTSRISGKYSPKNTPAHSPFSPICSLPLISKEFGGRANGGWVWTTFHSYQWDLNYANPAVFNRMAEEMLFLANQGVEVMRLDAVAFIWKQLGTNCENLPRGAYIN